MDKKIGNGRDRDSMNSITYSAARIRLASIIKTVCEDHEPIIITRQKESSVVMISLDDFKRAYGEMKVKLVNAYDPIKEI